MLANFLVLLVAVLCLWQAHAEFTEADKAYIYQCSYCVTLLHKLSETPTTPVDTLCRSLYGDIICDGMKLPSTMSAEGDHRRTCRGLGKCPADSLPAHPSVRSDPNIDIRVSKAMGSRGYNKLRISVISNQTLTNSVFNYNQRFQYRWTDKVLNTGLVSVTPGQTTSFTFGSETIKVYLPKENDGVRGIIVADPCFQSEWIVCVYQTKFQMFDHLTGLLNAASKHSDLHYWQILGDNFYDQAGQASSTWFNALSADTKSRIFATVPGNHDFWVNASPKLYVPKDQLGNGFMQFYGQDVHASLAGVTPYDFVNNPDGANKGAENLPPASNFFFYNKVGNVAFIGYSGAHSFSAMQSYFEEACNWAVDAKPDVLLLLGHWNNEGDGCDADTAVPAIYKTIIDLPSCAPLASKTRYFMGHKHCNIVTEKNVGFMVGAQGMSDASSCGGAFGIPVVDTTGGRFKVYYFPVDQANEFDNYDKIHSCFEEKGVSGCYDLAEVWADIAL